jgi:glycerophosphoryl diester phosphodiesterase
MSHHQPWPYARVLAHRGGGTLAPENTLAAIEVGLQHGYRAIEFDAMLAADAVPVLIHDPTLERTTNGAGEVAARSAAELTSLDAGAWMAPRFAGTRLPSLVDAIAYCRRNDIWINIEIKPAPGHESATGTQVAKVAARDYSDLVRPHGDRAGSVEPRAPLFSSFAREALAAARTAVPDLPRGLLVGPVPADWEDQLESLGCVGLHCSQKHLTRALARVVKDAGYWLFCYTVNDPQRARQLFDWGVDAFCTDRIDLIAASFA